MEIDDVDNILFGFPQKPTKPQIPQAKKSSIFSLIKPISLYSYLHSEKTSDQDKIPVFLLGYPCDVGSKIARVRPGQERGPSIFL